jgi:hypothetical protein
MRPENITRLRRFAVSLIKSKSTGTDKGKGSIVQKMRQLTMNTRAVFDYLKMTKNSAQITGAEH